MLIVLETSPVFDVLVHAESGAAANADSTPTCAVYEDATDVAILTPTVVSRGVAGLYRVTVAATAANGFEAGKTYNVIATAVVGGVTVRARIATFTAVASLGATQASVDAIDDFLDTEIAAIKAKTDNLPSDPADASVVAGLIAAVQATANSIETTVTDVPSISASVDVIATAVGVIQASTDNLPADPASEGLATANKDEILDAVAAVGVTASAIDARLPSDPADASVVAGLIAAVSTKVDAVDDMLDTEMPALTAAVAAVKVDTAAALVALAKMLGLSSENTYRDTTVYDGDGNLTSARLRAYDSAANATTHGATGLLYTWTFTATYSGPGAMTSMLLVAA